MSPPSIIRQNFLAIGTANEIKDMQSRGWQVICLTTTPPPVSCCWVPLVDGKGNSQEQIEKAVGFIRSCWMTGHPVYVCCRHGQNRSVCISAAAWTLEGYQEWMSNSLLEIAKYRPVASPRDDTYAEVLAYVLKMRPNR